MKKQVFFTCIFLICLTMHVQAQTNLDTIIIKYLRTVKGIPKPELTITKQNGKMIRSANYFVSPAESIKSKTNEFKTFLFGSASSHERKYLLIQVLSSKPAINKIVDNSSFEDAVKEVFHFLSGFEISDETKSFIIRQVTFAYN